MQIYNIFIVTDLSIVINSTIGPFVRVNSGDCESNGMRMIRSKKECEDASKLLGLRDLSAFELQDQSRPHGCVYADNEWLGWASPEGHPNKNVPCGSSDTFVYDCICARSGKIKYLLFTVNTVTIKLHGQTT